MQSSVLYVEEREPITSILEIIKQSLWFQTALCVFIKFYVLARAACLSLHLLHIIVATSVALHPTKIIGMKRIR